MRNLPKLAVGVLLASGLIFSAALCHSGGKEDRTTEKKITEKSSLERMKENVKEAEGKIKKDGQEAGREFKESGKELHDTAKKEFKKTGNALKKAGKELEESFRKTMEDLKKKFKKWN